jgi:site-specific DNA recombinase
VETADYAAKRRILEIVCLNCRLEGEKLLFSVRKPFDVLSEGLAVSENRGSRI